MMTKEELIAFEEEIAQLFNEGKIHSPIHLSKNNEEQLIKIFANIKGTDYVFSTHRSHFHFLLKTGDKEWLKKEILANRSIHINSNKYRFFSSAIVGGICPIAVGVAMGLHITDSPDKVWCFVGDAASRTGIFYESVRYAEGLDLPITFVIENNFYSVNSPTAETWGEKRNGKKCIYYEYQRDPKWAHSGTGEYIKF